MSEAFKDLMEIAKQLEKIPFSAITVNREGDYHLRNNVLFAPGREVGSLSEFMNTLESLNVYIVEKQTINFIHWSDKNALEKYLEMMGERETKDTSRLSALHIIAGASKKDYCEIVLKFINTPTKHLEMVLPLLMTIEEPVIKISDFLKKLSIDAIELPKRDEKPKPKQPFYTRFLDKRRKR